MKLSCLAVLFCAGSIHSQGINFGGQSSSGSSSGGSGGSGGSQDTDQRILGIIPGLSTGNSNTDNLINGGLLGAGLLAGAGVLTGAINPCGRKKRQTSFGDGGSSSDDGTNTRFFNPLCNTNSNNNNFFTGGGGSTGAGCNCQCSSLTFTSNGVTYGNCRVPDNTGRYWCYTTGYGNNGCGDLQQSSRYPNNPWSYNACNVQSQCYSQVIRDCRGRPQGDKYYGCGCNGRKRRQTKFFDIRCAEAAILGRNAPQQQK